MSATTLRTPRISPPRQYRALVGRTFRDVGPNGLNRTVKVFRIAYAPTHRWGPWLAVCVVRELYAVSERRPSYRKVDRFFEPKQYEEIS